MAKLPTTFCGIVPGRGVEWMSRRVGVSQGCLGGLPGHLPSCPGGRVAQQFWDDNLQTHGSPK